MNDTRVVIDRLKIDRQTTTKVDTEMVTMKPFLSSYVNEGEGG